MEELPNNLSELFYNGEVAFIDDDYDYVINKCLKEISIVERAYGECLCQE